MNTHDITEMTGLRELTVDELDTVAGGNPAVIGFVAGYLATKLLDDVAPAFTVIDDIKGMIKDTGK